MAFDHVSIQVPDECNVVIGQAHFIKTLEDLYEVMATTVPQASFGVAFNEASGACLVRVDGNDDGLQQLASDTAARIAAGHVFVLFMRGAYPINVLNRIKDCPEVCRVFCATANPLDVLVERSPRGAGVVGVIDGASPHGVEQEADREWRRTFLRKIGYKR